MREKLIQLLTENPKITQKEIAISLNISTPTVKIFGLVWSVNRLYEKIKRYKEISGHLSGKI